jgi:hypothetical protein
LQASEGLKALKPVSVPLFFAIAEDPSQFRDAIWRGLSVAHSDCILSEWSQPVGTQQSGQARRIATKEKAAGTDEQVNLCLGRHISVHGPA